MVERPQSFIDQFYRKSYLLKVIYPTVHTGSDENGSAIQNFFNILILWYVTTTNSFYKGVVSAILLVNEF